MGYNPVIASMGPVPGGVDYVLDVLQAKFPDTPRTALREWPSDCSTCGSPPGAPCRTRDERRTRTHAGRPRPLA